MKRSHRSVFGLAIAVLGLPVFLGLVACLPVPIGNPEKSRIDPDLTGMWLMDNESIVLLEPYDKRTWLMSMLDIKRYPDDCTPDEEADAVDAEDVEPEDRGMPDDDYARLVAELEADTTGCYGVDEVALYKVWRSEFGKRPFLTWEPMGALDEDLGFVKPIWYGFRLDKADADNFHLWMIDIDADEFDEIEALEDLMASDPPHDPRSMKRAQRAIEKVLRRNADTDAIYADNSLHFRRIHADDAELFGELVEDVIAVDQK